MHVTKTRVPPVTVGNANTSFESTFEVHGDIGHKGPPIGRLRVCARGSAWKPTNTSELIKASSTELAAWMSRQ